MTAALVFVSMLPRKVDDEELRSELISEELIVLSAGDYLDEDVAADWRLCIVPENVAPSKALLARLGGKVGNVGRLCAALHADPESATPAWRTALTTMFNDASIALFHNSPGDRIFDALQETLAAYDRLSKPDTSAAEYNRALGALAGLLVVDWDLEARLTLLHTCLTGGRPSPVLVGDVVEDGPALRALREIWVQSQHGIAERVDELAGSIVTLGEREREEKLRSLRDILLPARH